MTIQTADTAEDLIGVLSVSDVPEDHLAVRTALARNSSRVHTAGTCESAMKRLDRGGIAVVFCERDLPDGTWQDLLQYARAQSQPPLIIVASRTADTQFWAEVLNLGGFDVVAKPFLASELRHVLRSAWLRARDASRDASSVLGAA